MDAVERLAALFEKFPGIGPRQAGRFVRYLLRISPATRRELIESIQELSASVHQCSLCMRFHSGKQKMCSICSDAERNASTLAIVASDTDLAALEKSGTYRGHYFVLGGTIHLASEKADGLHIKELLRSIPRRLEQGLKEVILAFPANPEGDATALRLRDELAAAPGVSVTTLGRGLSTGSELEYADPETIKNALEGRH